MAQVKRARFAFTLHLVIEEHVVGPATGRPRVRLEVPGFASPPRDGFALDGPTAKDDLRPRFER